MVARRALRRFYTRVEAAADGGVLLDGKPVRTPARALLRLPTAALRQAVVDEWAAQGDAIDPRSMPLTGLANAAIDRVAADPESFAAGLARFAENDLLCYRAPGPDTLVARQHAVWDPLVAWAEGRYAVRFAIVSGIVHVAQSGPTFCRLRDAVGDRDPFALAGLSPLVTVGGSLVVALAVAEGAVTAVNAFSAVQLDEDWQAERWGRDPLAEAARDERRADFAAGARFLALLA